MLIEQLQTQLRAVIAEDDYTALSDDQIATVLKQLAKEQTDQL